VERAVPNQVVPLQLQLDVVATTELRERNLFFQLGYQVLGDAGHWRERVKGLVFKIVSNLKLSF